MNSPARSKLFKLKQWLTLPEAARHLSGICGEEVTEADILRLALDGHLKLSVYFVNHADVKLGHVVHFPKDKLLANLKDGIFPTELRWIKGFYGETICLSTIIGEEKYLNLEHDKVIGIDGVWDLAMIGSERLDIEHRYQLLTGGPAVTLVGLDGAFVTRCDEEMYQLQESYEYNEYQIGSRAYLEKLEQDLKNSNYSSEKVEALLAESREDRKRFLESKSSRPTHENYYPASGLPQDCVLVVRTEALREFEQFISDNQTEKKPSTKPHGNAERYSGYREQILGAALSVIAHWPEQCKNNSGKFEAAKIAKLVDAKSFLFWPKTGDPPLTLQKMERVISKWINRVVQ